MKKSQFKYASMRTVSANALWGKSRRFILSTGVAALVMAGVSHAAPPIGSPATHWLGATDGSWIGNNWASDANGSSTPLIPTATDDITFSAKGAANQNTTLGADFTIHSLTITDSKPVTIGAGGAFKLTISGNAGTGIDVQSGAGLFTLNADLVLAGSSDTITVNSGSPTASNSSGAVINGAISGNNALIKNGTGKLTLTGTNTYTASSAPWNGTVVNAGTLELTGSTASITHTNKDLIVGDALLNILNGADVSVGAIGIDGTSNTRGVLLVSGAGSTLTANGAVYIGTTGTGTLSIQSGATAQVVNLNVGNQSGAQGFVIVNGAGSTATVSNAVFLGLADNSAGSLLIDNGASLSTINVTAGCKIGSQGTVAVNGAGSVLTTSNSIFLGEGANSTAGLTVSTGAKVNIGSNLFVGNVANSNATATITGANSLLNTTQSIFVGNFGNGTMNILAGAQATSTAGFIGAQTTGVGVVNVSGPGSSWTISGGSNPLLAVGSQGDGVLTIANGAVVTSTGSSQVGLNGGNSHGSVSVSGGSEWHTTSLVSVGYGDVTISGGSAMTGAQTIIGTMSGKTGSLKVTGAGSTADFGGFLQIGGGGIGQLQVLDGGKVTSIGYSTVQPGSTVQVDGVGSSWVNTGDLDLRSGTSLTISGGGVVQNTRAFLSLGGNTVLLTGAGSQWINTSEVALGQSSSAALTVADGAVLRIDDNANVGGGAIFLGDSSSATGTLNIGAAAGDPAAAAGTIQAAVVSSGFSGGGLAVVNFNHTSIGYTFDPLLTRNLAVNQLAGVTIIDRANDYTGGTTISGGTLQTQNSNALGSGAVTLAGTGILATASPLTISSFNWNGGQLQVAPATGNILNVTGAMTNGGGGAFILDTANLTQGSNLTLATFGSAPGFSQGGFSATTLNPNVVLQGSFLLNPNDLQFTITGATATGSIIQNSAPVGIPTFADFIVSGPVHTAGGDNTIQSLTFLPGGSLDLFSTLTVTQGPVNLVGGSSLHLNNGTLSASELNVLLGATLHGNGTINGNLYNAGLVSPGNSPGKIYITGHYTQASSGTLRIEIAGRRDGQYDQLLVSGGASLDGTLQLVKLGKFKLKHGDKITFLRAEGGVDGEFSDVEDGLNSDTILESKVVYEDTTVSVEAARGSFEDFADHAGLTPNQQSVAEALDSLSADKPHNKALVYLDERNLNDLPSDFDKIAPEELTSIFSISTSLATVQGQNLQRRTDDIRNGSAGFSAAGLAINGQTPSYSGSFAGAAGPSGKESKDVKEVAPLDEKKWGVFLSGTGEWVDVSGDGNARGFDLTTGGFTLGLDYKVTPNFAVGLMAGYAGTSADLTDDGRVWVNGGKLGVYATYFTGGFYVDAAVNGGYNSYDTKRSALQGTARGSTDGGELNVLVGTGYDWKIGALTLGPTATFSYTLVGIDGFTEHGSLTPLDISDRDAESVKSAFGFKASYDWKAGGVVIRPELRAAWQHEYGDRSYDISASFANGGGDNFLVNGPNIGRDSLLLGAGFAVQLSETFTTYLYYDGELGRDRYESHSVSGGIRVAF